MSSSGMSAGQISKKQAGKNSGVVRRERGKTRRTTILPRRVGALVCECGAACVSEWVVKKRTRTSGESTGDMRGDVGEEAQAPGCQTYDSSRPPSVPFTGILKRRVLAGAAMVVIVASRPCADDMQPSQIQARKLTFDVERAAGGIWNPTRPELSHTLNAFQLALPYLEPYFIDAIREASERLDDERLKADAVAFCSQEANHSREHMRYTRYLRQRYPGLRDHELAIRNSLEKSKAEDSLEWRLAYTAGYEAITGQLARWMFRCSEEWFGNADSEFAAMMTWHAAEELEHRSVAWDVFQAIDTNYALRARGLFAALAKTYADMTPVVTYMLGVDGYAGRLDSKLRRFRLRIDFVSELFPVALHYLAPGYHPSREKEPEAFASWLAAHEKGLSSPGAMAP
jgi:predicted metal-dependent hydrolase